jgi:hypothetical protein
MTSFDASPKDLSVKEGRALVALLTEPTITKAAKQAGVSTRSLYRLMQKPSFREALRQSISVSLDRLYVRLAAGSDAALTALSDLVTGEKTEQQVRRLAASDWIQHFTRLLEDRDLSERLASLEAAIKQENQP